MRPKSREISPSRGVGWQARIATPKSRLDYSLPKLRRNQQRDAVASHTLDRLGWKVLVIWECQATTEEAAAEIIALFLEAE